MGVPESSPKGSLRRSFFIFLKNPNVAILGIPGHSCLARIRRIESIWLKKIHSLNPAMGKTAAGREQEFVSGLMDFSYADGKDAVFQGPKSTRSRCARGDFLGGIPRSLASPIAPARTCPGDFFGGNADPAKSAFSKHNFLPFFFDVFMKSGTLFSIQLS